MEREEVVMLGGAKRGGEIVGDGDGDGGDDDGGAGEEVG